VRCLFIYCISSVLSMILKVFWCGFICYCLCKETKLLISMTLGIGAWMNIFQHFVKMGVM
jgi:hypothetical protein